MKLTLNLLFVSTFLLSCQSTPVNQKKLNNEVVTPPTSSTTAPATTPATSAKTHPPITNMETSTQTSTQTNTSMTAKTEQVCPGDTELPAHLSGFFVPIEDDELLQSVLGEPDKGALCQGKVYQSVGAHSVEVFRAWNSTNPNSEMGTWWADTIPTGLTSQYRIDYEICYQWSPLDKMTQCTLKSGSKVVIGTGQSAMCSDYLTYPASPEKQIYIQNASEVLENCEQHDAIFNWQSI